MKGGEKSKTLCGWVCTHCTALHVLCDCVQLAAAEEVVDMRGAGLTQTYFYSLVR